MTVDHLYRLSHGKPNQIRLICHGIYRRYQRGEQRDLNITIEALDEVLDSIHTSFASEYDLKLRVDMIRRLNSTDLEALYLITRYPEWRGEDVVALDEAFRGERVSPRAAKRRAQRLETKRSHFLALGLLQDQTTKYALVGDEVLQLYLRFWYEVQKFGDLRKRLDLGGGPPTPFGEKVDKLVRSLSWEAGRTPGVVMIGRSESDARHTEVIANVRQRLSTLERVTTAGSVETREEAASLLDCFQLCHLVARRAPYYVLVMSVRNLENPREQIVSELYFEGNEPLVIRVDQLAQQAEAARLVVEEWDGWMVRVPTLEELVQVASGQTLDDIIQKSGIFGAWFVRSVRQFVQDRDDRKDTKEEAPEEDGKTDEWVNLYRKGNADLAVAQLTQRLAMSPKRPRAARLYNDRGYIRYGLKGDHDNAKKDLDRALDLHNQSLQLTLLNLSVIAIDNGDFAQAIELIQDALFITQGRESEGAACLRLRVLAGHLMFTKRENWEQEPANALEAAYVNLGYAVAREGGYQDAQNVFEEGLELMPSSVRLRHALARLHLSERRAPLADPLFRELATMDLGDPALANEVNAYMKIGQGSKRRKF